jgi:Domain of unknown function (DUF4157)
MFAQRIAKAQVKAAESATSKLAPQRSTAAPRQLGGGALERAYASEETLGLLAEQAWSPANEAPAQGTEGTHKAATTPGLSWDFSKVPVFPPDRPQAPTPLVPPPPARALQTKLLVGRVNDPFEYEADRIADQVMATPAHHAVSGALPRIQRFSGQSNGQMDAAPASVGQAPASPGRPLEPTLRRDMEQRFGHDFSRVRVHSDAGASESARLIDANAYTAGRDIVFGADRFAPGTPEGRRLIAHELTHVVQQSDAHSAGGTAVPATSVQRDSSSSSPLMSPDKLIDE